MSKRKYTVYTQELRDKAFALFCEGKSNSFIQKELNIGDSSGVSKIKKQDNWEVRRKLLQQNVQIMTQAEAMKQGSIVGKGLSVAVEEYAKRNAEILGKVRDIGDICMKYIDDGKNNGVKPKSFNEAVHLWLEAIRLERSLIGSSIEETFVMQVFDVLRSEISDIDTLKRIGLKLRALVK